MMMIDDYDDDYYNSFKAVEWRLHYNFYRSNHTDLYKVWLSGITLFCCSHIGTSIIPTSQLHPLNCKYKLVSYGFVNV